jgi:hypothetical protein
MTRPPHNGDRQPDHDPEPDHDSDRRSPADAGGLPDQLALAELANASVPDVVDGVPPVPINVWRLTDVGRPDASRPGSGLPPQLAVLLLGVFTRPGELVVDVAADAALAGVACAGARLYLPVHDPTDLVKPVSPTSAARLAFLPWPLPAPSSTDTTGTNPAAAAAVLTACRRLLAADGCLIVALAPTAAQLPYIEQSQLVIHAAHQAGLSYLQHIIVTIALTGSQPAPEVGDVQPMVSDTEMAASLNLLVFGRRGGPP